MAFFLPLMEIENEVEVGVISIPRGAVKGSTPLPSYKQIYQTLSKISYYLINDTKPELGSKKNF